MPKRTGLEADAALPILPNRRARRGRSRPSRSTSMLQLAHVKRTFSQSAGSGAGGPSDGADGFAHARSRRRSVGGSASGSATVPAGPGKHAHFKFPARPAVVPSTQAAAAIVAGGDSNWSDGGNQAGGCVLEAA
jgi:hypothetical protein